ncbi:MAG TPA: hypothetical protein VGM91_10435 [Conexibacter sp.]|jgi:hypothetical protein
MTAPLAFACEQTDPNLLPREQRDRIRTAVIDGLAELRLIVFELEAGNVAAARERRATIADDLLLLDDLGWDEDDNRDSFALTMNPDALRATLARVRESDPDGENAAALVEAVGHALALVRDDAERAGAEQGDDDFVAVTIVREQRDVLFDQLVADLSSVGDLHIELSAGHLDSARELRRRYFDEMRLFDEIGWGAEDPGETFAIRMERTALVDTLSRLNMQAAEGIRGHIDSVATEQEAAQECAAACAVIGDVLADVARGRGADGAAA